MNWSDAEKKEKRHQEDLDRLRSFRPMDDTFMRGLFKENLPLAELVLRIITGKPDLILTKCETQADMKRVTVRVQSVWMPMQPTVRARSMTLRSSARTMAQTRTGQDIIPV